MRNKGTVGALVEREGEKARQSKGSSTAMNGRLGRSRLIRTTLNSHGRGKGDTRLRIELISRDSNVPAGIPLSILIPRVISSS